MRTDTFVESAQYHKKEESQYLPGKGFSPSIRPRRSAVIRPEFYFRNGENNTEQKQEVTL